MQNISAQTSDWQQFRSLNDSKCEPGCEAKGALIYRQVEGPKHRHCGKLTISAKANKADRMIQQFTPRGRNMYARKNMYMTIFRAVFYVIASNVPTQKNILYDYSDDKVQKSGSLWMWEMDIEWEGT